MYSRTHFVWDVSICEPQAEQMQEWVIVGCVLRLSPITNIVKIIMMKDDNTIKFFV